MAVRSVVIRGGLLLDPYLPLERLDVEIEGDTVVAVGSELGRLGAEVIDASGLLVMPGLINAHTHSCQSLDQGVVPNLPLDLWMVWAVWAGIELSAEEVYTAAAAGALDLLHTGCTAVIDHAVVAPHEFDAQCDALMQAYEDTGLRAAVAPILQDESFGASLPLHLAGAESFPAELGAGADRALLLAGTARFVERWARRHPRLAPMVGPSAPQRCSDELLAELARLVREQDVGFHTHLLEAKSQVLAGRRRYGRSVVEHLARLGLLGPQASFAHAIWLDRHEYRVLRDSGSILVHNPVSNLHTGSGIMPLQYLLELGVAVGLGADGAATGDQDMFEVAKLATLLHTLYGDFRRWPQPIDVWGMGLQGGAAAMRQPIGRIEPGAKADLVLIRPGRPLAASKEGAVADLVYSRRARSVETVLVGGEVVLTEGASTRVTEGDVAERAAALRTRIHAHITRRSETYASAEDALTSMLDAVAREELDVLVVEVRSCAAGTSRPVPRRHD